MSYILINAIELYLQANQVIIWAVWLGGFNIGIVISIHAMSSYCIFSLHTTLHKRDALQKLNRQHS